MDQLFLEGSHLKNDANTSVKSHRKMWPRPSSNCGRSPTHVKPMAVSAQFSVTCGWGMLIIITLIKILVSKLISKGEILF